MAEIANLKDGNPTIISLMIQDNALDLVKGQWRLLGCTTEKKAPQKNLNP